jgi:hypothetical protein
MIKSFRKTIKTADIFGESILLNIKKEYKTKSFFGGILTIITIGLLIGALWSVGNDFFYKLQPTTDLEDYLYTVRPTYNLNKKTFPIAFCFQTYDQMTYNIPEYFKFELIGLKTFTSNTTTIQSNYEYENCTYDHFPLLSKESIAKAGLPNYLCPKDQNLAISGYWDNDYIEYITLRLRMCNNETDGGTCAPQEEINAWIQRAPIAFNIYYQNSIINQRNYTDPVQYFISVQYKNIRLSSSKVLNMYVRSQEIQTDTGVLLPDPDTQTSYAYDTSDVDDSDADKASLMDINIMVANHKLIYHREYIKIQTILANIGGIKSALFIGMYLVSVYFSQLRLNQTIFNKIFDFHLEGSGSAKTENTQQRRTSVFMKRLSANFEQFYKQNIQRKRTDSLDSIKEMKGESDDSRAESDKESKNENLCDPNSVRIKFREDENNTKPPTLSTNELMSQYNDKYAKVQRTKKNISIQKKKSYDKIMDTVNFKTKSNRKLKLTFFEMMLKPIFSKCVNPSTRVKYTLFDKASDELMNYLDISNIVHKLEEFEKFKLTLLNTEQLAMFQFISKDVCSLEDRAKLDSEITKLKRLSQNKEELVHLVLDYKFKLESVGEHLSVIDKKLFAMLDDDIKSKLE